MNVMVFSLKSVDPTAPVPTPFEVAGLGQKLRLAEGTRLAVQEMTDLGMSQVSSTSYQLCSF